MSGPVTVTSTGAEVARICANAGAFVPARANTKMLALRSLAGRLEARGTDGYAAGVDSTEAATTGVISVALTLDDLGTIESAARKQKKGAVTLSLDPESVTLQWATPSGRESETVPCEPYPLAWSELDRLMNRAYGEERPEFVAYDPALFSRFAKVRCESDRVMDLWFADSQKPVLVKIGPTFRGLVMPLQRERAAEYAPEGLW